MSSGDEQIEQLKQDRSGSEESDFAINKRRGDRPKSRPKAKTESLKRVKESRPHRPDDHPKGSPKKAKLEAKRRDASDDEDEEAERNGRAASKYHDDEHDEDDEEDDRRRRASRAKRSKRRLRKDEKLKDYIESEASVDEEERSEEDSLEHQRRKEELKQQYRQRSNMDIIPRREINEMEGDQINALYDQLDKEGGEDFDNEGIEPEFPTNFDPKLFSVRCKTGLEREAVVSLLRKSYDWYEKMGEFIIFSASAIDKIPGSVFVEAYKEKAVRDICDGLVALNKDLIKIIPISQVRDVFRPDPNKNIRLEANKFVRVKNGAYAGDLGLVEDVDIGRSAAIIKLVPRLLGATDRVARHYAAGDSSRPQKKLFNKDDYPATEVSKIDSTNINKIVYVFRGEKFENGFVKKRFPISNLLVDNVRPSYDEISVFKKAEPNEAKWAELMKQLTLVNDPNRNMKSMVQKGDNVRVTAGDMIGLQGRVVEVLADTIKVDFGNQFGIPVTDFKAQDLEKVFSIGEQIEVVNGQHAGKIGSIVSFDDKKAVFITDDTHEELPAFLTDLRTRAIGTSAVDPNRAQKVPVEKFDLISLNEGQTVGLVVAVHTDLVVVIDSENCVTSFSQSKVEKKFNRLFVASNMRNETIQEKCVVNVLSGPQRGVHARVVKVYNNKVFLLDQNRRETYGVFVENAENLAVLETPSYDNTRKLAMYNNQARLNLEKEEAYGGMGGAGLPPRPPNARNNPQSMRLGLIGQTKKIVKGQYKGFEGIIQSIIGNEVRFELSAERKVVKVPLDYLNVNNLEKETIASAAMNTARTPTLRNPASATFNFYNTGTPAYKPFQ